MLQSYERQQQKPRDRRIPFGSGFEHIFLLLPYSLFKICFWLYVACGWHSELLTLAENMTRWRGPRNMTRWRGPRNMGADKKERVACAQLCPSSISMSK